MKNKVRLAVLNDKIGNKIESLRKDRGLSQKALASSIGVSAAALSLIEKGHRQPGLEVLASISLVFNISLDSLVFGNNTKQKLFERSANNLSSADQILVNQLIKRLIKGSDDL